jgi:predicted dehydrogenase
MTAALRAAVIGLGAMGRHHARVLSELPDVELVAVADVSQDQVDLISQAHNVPGFTDIDAMLEDQQLDMVSIVVPTSLHHEVSIKAMRLGINVLCEKPIASTVELAHEMIQVSRDEGVRLMIGHIERFNPAILELKKRLDQAGEIYQVTSRRLGPFPDRIRDVGVVVDLASHDIDAMNFLLESPAELVFAQTAQRIHATNEDMVYGTIRFENGVIGGLDVNWLTSTKVRELMVVGSRGTFVADYLTQDLAFYANGAVESNWKDLPDLQRIAIGESVGYEFEKVEPLHTEISSFVDAVVNDTAVPAPPEGAANALAIALSLIESARGSVPVQPTLLPVKND